MTAQQSGMDSWLDDFVAWRNQAVEEAWESIELDGEPAPALANAFDITDMQHWLDLCA
jgi:hypothetical protein